jgi:glutaredoxin 2
MEENNKRVIMHRQVCSGLTKTYRDKNSDYGDSFVKVREEFPNAILIRLSDKLNRLKTLYSGKEQMVQDESIVDTLSDLANYCIMEIIEIQMQISDFEDEMQKVSKVARETYDSESFRNALLEGNENPFECR